MPDEEESRPFPSVEHDWEDVPLEPRRETKFEFDAPSKEDPSVIEHVTLNLNLSFAYARPVPGAERDAEGKVKYEPIVSLRRCRACLQDSTNGEEPREPCGLAQVRRVMTE